MSVNKSFVAAILFFLSSGNIFAQWQAVLSCDGGSAKVDVDTNDRRHLQVVIRN